MKMFFRSLLVLLALFVVSTPVEARVDLPALNENHYFVQDNAGVLSDSTIQELNDLGTHLEEGTGAELPRAYVPGPGIFGTGRRSEAYGERL